MDERVRFNPFTGGTTPRGGLLSNTPLVMVLCQVQWPELTVLRQNYEQIAERIGELLTEFPLRTVSKQYSFGFGTNGVSEPVEWSVYQWSDVEQGATVTLTPDFVTVSTADYSGGYQAFSETLQRVLRTVHDVAAIPVYDRVGIRYINRIPVGHDLDRVAELIKPQARGLSDGLAQPAQARLVESQTVGLYDLGPGKLQSRVGTLPAGQVPDPAVPPIDNRSWVVDIDAYEEGRRVFTVDGVLVTTSRLSDAARDFLGYVSEPAFTTEFGGAG